MNRFVQPHVVNLQGYVPGEQPDPRAKVIKLNTNENPYPCSAKVKAAIGRVVQQGLQRYPDPTATAFRLAAADILKIDADWILCGNGSDDLLTIITRAFVAPGELVRFAHPGYVLYGTLAAIQNARVEQVTFEDDWSLPPKFAEHADGLRLVLLANPNSPSGTMISPERISQLAAALPCALVVDEAYVDFASADCLQLVQQHENLLVTRTLSKGYALAGLRFGYLVAQPDLIAQLAKVKDSYNCDAVAIAGATAAIADQSWCDANHAAIRATRQRLQESLAQLGFSVTPSQANFLWVTHSEQPHQAIFARLKRDGVLVRYLDYGKWGDGLRITVGTDEQVDVLLQLLEESLT